MNETDVEQTQIVGEDQTSPMTRQAQHARPQALRRGDALGRYVVIDVLGKGGMGVVYSAYDPDLGRPVAIKLLHPSPRGDDDSLGRGRLLREAQALAQLQHPNVITVHDVGEHEGQVFVAMEYIQGLTLRAWLDDQPRPWREVLDVMLAAGRGLRAAHAKGMIHRDFKPDNVMLATDTDGRIERILVMDFGLATPVGVNPSAPEDITSSAESQLRASVELASLTETGAVMGTPAYMAPEQHHGHTTDDRTDQFSFCVTLYEALYGRRPFAGNTVFAIIAACTKGEIQPPPRGSRVPRWLYEIVERGLASDPIERWPSMAALLEALQRDPTRRRRWLVAGTCAVLAAGLAYGGSVVLEQRRLAECRDTADSIDEVWNEQVRQRVREGILGTGLSYAPSTWERLQPQLDQSAEQWRRTRYEECAEPTVDPELASVQLECLEARRAALENELELLEQATAPVVNKAIHAVMQRGRSDRCTDPVQLRRRPRLPADPQLRASAVERRRRLDRAQMLTSVGRYDDAQELADAIIEEARQSDDRYVLAWARIVRAKLHVIRGEYETAEAMLEDAFFEARAAGAPSLAALAASRLANLAGRALVRTADGLRWLRHASVLAEEARHDAVTYAYYDQIRAAIEIEAGNLERAREHLEAAIEVIEAELGADSSSMLEPLTLLAIVHDRLGDSETATELLARVLERSKEMYGPDHPETADAHNDLAAALLATGDLSRSQRHLEQAILLYERAELQVRLGSSLTNLTLVQRELGDLTAALKTSVRAVEVRRATMPPEHPAIADALINQGQTLTKLGEHAKAITVIEEALSIYERAYEPENPRVGDGHNILSSALLKAGKFDGAAGHLRRALEIYRAALPDDHPSIIEVTMGLAIVASHHRAWAELLETAKPLADELPDGKSKDARETRGTLQVLVGEALLETGEPVQALPWARRGMAQLEDPSSEAELLRAYAEIVAGRAQWEADTDRAGAIALVRGALPRLLKKDPQVSPRWIASTEQWLAEHAR